MTVEELEQGLAELALTLAELRQRVTALEVALGAVRSKVPKWDDMEHRHTEEEFGGVTG